MPRHCWVASALMKWSWPDPLTFNLTQFYFSSQCSVDTRLHYLLIPGLTFVNCVICEIDSELSKLTNILFPLVVCKPCRNWLDDIRLQHLDRSRSPVFTGTKAARWKMLTNVLSLFWWNAVLWLELFVSSLWPDTLFPIYFAKSDDRIRPRHVSALRNKNLNIDSFLNLSAKTVDKQRDKLVSASSVALNCQKVMSNVFCLD